MSSKSLGCDYNFILKGSEIAVLGEKAAVEILYQRDIRSISDPIAKEAFIKEKEEEYKNTYMTGLEALESGCVDRLIESDSIRREILNCLEDVREGGGHGNVPL